MRQLLTATAAAAALLLPALPAQSQLGPQQWGLNNTLDGDAAGDLFGYAVAGLAVAAPLEGPPPPAPVWLTVVGAFSADVCGSNSGAVYVYEGGTQTLAYPPLCGNPGDLLGFAVANLGDLDLDGTEDFAVSAPYFSGGFLLQGLVNIYSGATGAPLGQLFGQAQSELFGSSLAGVDIDGDGSKELVVGAPGANGQTGRIYVYPWTGSAFGIPAMENGIIAAEQFGYALADGGLLDPSAGNEILVGVPFSNAPTPLLGTISGSGAIDVIGGNMVQRIDTVYGSTAGEHLGKAVSGGRQLGGFDGKPEIIGGAPDWDDGGPTRIGRVLVFDGDTAQGVFHDIRGANGGDRFGFAVQSLPDTTGDSKGDLAVGAPFFASREGRVFVYDLNPPAPGAPTPIVTHTISGETGSRLGWTLDLFPDINGDTVRDLGVGAPYFSGDDGSRQGRAEEWIAAAIVFDPVELTLDCVPAVDEDLQVTAINLKPGANVDFRVDTQNPPRLAPGTLAGTVTGVDQSGVAVFTINSTFFPPAREGSELFFIAIEDDGNELRESNIPSDFVAGDIPLNILGDITPTQTVDVEVTDLMPGDIVNFFYLQGPGNPIDDGTQFGGNAIADGAGVATATLSVPGGADPNQDMCFQARVQFDGFCIRRSEIACQDVLEPPVGAILTILGDIPRTSSVNLLAEGMAPGSTVTFAVDNDNNPFAGPLDTANATANSFGEATAAFAIPGAFPANTQLWFAAQQMGGTPTTPVETGLVVDPPATAALFLIRDYVIGDTVRLIATGGTPTFNVYFFGGFQDVSPGTRTVPNPAGGLINLNQARPIGTGIAASSTGLASFEFTLPATASGITLSGKRVYFQALTTDAGVPNSQGSSTWQLTQVEFKDIP